MSGRHIPALDGLRGLAVLGVVAHHLDVLRGGYLGVDAFFVLSGFLITGLLVDEAELRSTSNRPIRLGAFWTRRAKRLLPAMGAVLLVVGVVERWVIDGSHRAVELRNETIAAVAYVFNWQQISDGVDYWSTFDAPSPLRHMWSLGIEEQFYVVWPLVVVAAALLALRRSWALTTTMVVVAAVGAIVSVVWSQVLFDPRDPLRSYYGTDVRVAAMLFGVVAAMLVRRLRAPSLAAQRRLGAVGLVLIAPIGAAWVALDGESELLYRGGLTASAVATAIVLFAAVQAPASPLARVLSVPVLRWFGRISYGLYLWHWPMIVWLTPARVGVDGIALFVARAVATMAATLVSYHLLEQPIRLSRAAGRATLAWSTGAVAVVVVLVTVGATSTATERVEAGTRDTTPIPTLATTTTPAPLPDTTITTTTTITSVATVATDPAPTPAPLERLLVAGDSGAYFLGERIASVADDVVVVQRGQVGCGVLTVGGGIQTPSGLLPDAAECASFPTRLRSDVEAFQPTHVLFVYSWPGIGEREIDGALVGPCDPRFDLATREQLATLVDIAGSTGARVVVADIPYFLTPTGSAGAVDMTDCLNVDIADVVEPNDVLPLGEWTCPGGACRLRIDEAVLRPDGLHFEGPGGLAAAEWIVDQLRGANYLTAPSAPVGTSS